VSRHHRGLMRRLRLSPRRFAAAAAAHSPGPLLELRAADRMGAIRRTRSSVPIGGALLEVTQPGVTRHRAGTRNHVRDV
jgi:hypothetical protein